jgi:hypothetical protein
MSTTSKMTTKTDLLQDASNDLPESIGQTQGLRGKLRSRDVIQMYLLENVEEFRQLTKLRDQVSENAKNLC